MTNAEKKEPRLQIMLCIGQKILTFYQRIIYIYPRKLCLKEAWAE